MIDETGGNGRTIPNAADLSARNALEAALVVARKAYSDAYDDRGWREYWGDIVTELQHHLDSGWRIMTDDRICQECGMTIEDCCCVNGDSDAVL